MGSGSGSGSELKKSRGGGEVVMHTRGNERWTEGGVLMPKGKVFCWTIDGW